MSCCHVLLLLVYLQIPVTSLPGYLVQMLPPQTAESVMEEVGREISRYISSMERDIPAADVVVSEEKSDWHGCRDMHVQRCWAQPPGGLAGL
jgi:hypothetical protein